MSRRAQRMRGADSTHVRDGRSFIESSARSLRDARQSLREGDCTTAHRAYREALIDFGRADASFACAGGASTGETEPLRKLADSVAAVGVQIQRCIRRR